MAARKKAKSKSKLSKPKRVSYDRKSFARQAMEAVGFVNLDDKMPGLGSDSGPARDKRLVAALKRKRAAAATKKRAARRKKK